MDWNPADEFLGPDPHVCEDCEAAADIIDEMLAALKATLADFEAWAKIRGGTGTYQPAMDRIRTAIARATGQAGEG